MGLFDVFHFKRSTTDPERTDQPDDEVAAPPKRRRIRCPKCTWQPRPGDRWACTCLHAWNTFDTAGICPRCGRQWEVTQCLRCGEWSKHVDWYEPADDA